MGKEADILAKIVVVEDDVYMREELLNLLEKSGYDTIGLSDFENAVSEIAAYFPDLILLDINLPFRSGFEICKELKAKQIGTVLVLTARDKLQDELHALDLGADDYLTKPCNMSRLLARIKNLLRRKEEQVQQGLLDGGGFLLDPNTFTIYVGNSSYLMPPNEGKILLALLKNSPKIVSKKEFIDKYEQKVGDYYISSIVYGYGYMKIPKCKKQRISYITLIGNDCKPIWGYVIPR